MTGERFLRSYSVCFTYFNEVSLQGNSSLTGCCSKSNMLNWWRCREKSQMVNLHSACARHWLSPRNVAGSRAWPVRAASRDLSAPLATLTLTRGDGSLIGSSCCPSSPLSPLPTVWPAKTDVGQWQVKHRHGIDKRQTANSFSVFQAIWGSTNLSRFFLII